MKTLLLITAAALVAFLPTIARADRITATVTITNLPVEGDTLVFNTTRTWKTNVTSAATQIGTANSIGQATTNLWQQIISHPFAGPVNPIWVATNQIQLRAANGQAVSASLTGTWGTLTLSTQTVVSAKAVMVPLSSEPVASVRTNIISQLVDDIFNNGLATTAAGQTSSVLSNYVNTGGSVQTIGGDKTFTGTNRFNGTANVYNGGQVTNASMGNIRSPYALTNNGIMYFASGGSDPSYAIAPDSNGRPSIWTVTINGSFERVLGTLLAYTPTDNNLLTYNVALIKFAQLAGPNAFLGTNSFAQVTN